jgi:hypothetical protein
LYVRAAVAVVASARRWWSNFIVVEIDRVDRQIVRSFDGGV